MSDMKLWNLAKEWKSNHYKWSRSDSGLSAETPHWYGFKPFEAKEILFDYLPIHQEDISAPILLLPIQCCQQYGTHVDVPRHFL